MDKTYRDTVSKMEKNTTDPEYILGWEGGYLGHPKRESQRITDAYTAGYEDGRNKVTDNFKTWTKKNQ